MSGAAAPRTDPTPAALLPFPSAHRPPAPSPSTVLRADEQPAVRLQRFGVASLSDTELVALLLRHRVRTEADLRHARTLLRDGLTTLLRRAATRAADVRASDATRLAAAIELARRGLGAAASDEREVFDLDVAGPRLAAHYALQMQEHLGVILLDSRGRIIAQREVFIGTLHTAFVSTREIVRLALDHHAVSIVLYHNHPSHDPLPSGEDIAFTLRLRSAAQLLDIAVVDHLILGGHRYVSMKRRGDF